MNNLICFDVDGTLNNSKTHVVSDSTRKALVKLREKGYLLCIATGRNIDSLITGGFCDIIDWDGYICDNGITVHYKDKSILTQQYYPQEVVLNAINTAKEHRISLMYQTAEGQFLEGPMNDFVKEAHVFFHEPLPVEKAYDGEPVLMMAVYKDVDDKYPSFQNLKGIHLAYSRSTYADLVYADVNKHIGIKHLMNELGADEYIAFGDSMNDLEMLDKANLSILMGQGDMMLKPYADFVTKTIDEDGIYYACQQLTLID